MAHDLKYKGAPIFFSWPSNSDYMKYPSDVQNIEWSEPHIASFIQQVASQTQATAIFLIGHSMGARGLAKVAVQLIPSLSKPSLLRGLILSAPDIDSDVFQTQIAPNLVSHTNLTLYASSDDRALNMSKSINGYPRAGDAAGGVLTIPGMDSIDATGLDASFIGHSYFSTVRSVISDIFYIVNMGLSPDQRHGLIREVDRAGQPYWRFQL